jgi:hypothetical protein
MGECLTAVCHPRNSEFITPDTKEEIMKRVLSVVFYIFATMGICTGQSTLYFPQIAEGVQSDGIDWGMIIAITNSGGMNANVTLTLLKEDGTPFPPINLKQYGAGGPQNLNQSSITFQLTVGQTTVFISPGESGQSTTALQTGYAVVTSNPSSVAGTVIFSEVGPGGRIAQAGVFSATPLSNFETLAIAPSPAFPTNIYPANTATSAIALTNPSDSDALVTFVLVDGNDQPSSLSPVGRRLAAHTHTAFFVNQLFPNMAANLTIGGMLRVVSNAPLAATALLFQSNGQFATIPIIPYP